LVTLNFKNRWLRQELPSGSFYSEISNQNIEIPFQNFQITVPLLNFGDSSYQIKFIFINSEFCNAEILNKYFNINLLNNTSYFKFINKLKKKLILISSRLDQSLTNSLFTTKHFTFSENLKEKQPSHSSKFLIREQRSGAPERELLKL